MHEHNQHILVIGCIWSNLL